MGKAMELTKERFKVLFKYKDLIIQLVTRDLKLKYRRSFLGYLWSILNPLLIMLVMTIVFSHMFSKGISNFPVYLLTGRCLFEFTVSSTNQAMRAITGNSALIKKTYVPMYIFPLAKVTSCMVDFVFSLGALLLVMIFTGSPFYLTALLFPLVVLQLYVFCCGLGFFLAQANVFFRDVQYIYHAITTAWMYLTPLFYPLSMLPHNLQFMIKYFNPLFYYVRQFRDIVYSGILPTTGAVLGGIGIALVMLFIGLFTFKKQQDKFILYI